MSLKNMSAMRWIDGIDARRLGRLENKAQHAADSMVDDLPVDDTTKQLLKEFYFNEYGLEHGRGLVDEVDLLEQLDRCKIALEEAFGDDPMELSGEVATERPSTANALGRTALDLEPGSVEPDVIGA